MHKLKFLDNIDAIAYSKCPFLYYPLKPLYADEKVSVKVK